MTLTSFFQQIKAGEVSSVELVEASLDKIAERDPACNAFITVAAKEARQAAVKLDEEAEKKNFKGQLHGIPIAIKDMINTHGIRTTMGSKVYENHYPEMNAEVVNRLEEAGAVIIGKTNTHEFAYGPTGDRSFFGTCHNPYNPQKITGGSSSGSGAAVGAGMVAGAIGTDTGGSVRIPASACGVVGMKPTFGLVSKVGAFPLAYTLDHIGPMTNTIRDNALLLNVMAGYDFKDPHSVQRDVQDYSERISKDVSGLKIGIPDWYFERIEEEVSDAVESCIKLYEQIGIQVKLVNMPVMRDIATAQIVTIQAEATAVHQETMQNHKDELDREVYDRLIASQSVRGYEYVQSQIKRSSLIKEYNLVFNEVDALLTPTLPILPTDIGQREVRIGTETESVRSALLRLTSPTNYTGNPSLSLPCGLSESGLPIGVQLIGKHWSEGLLYQLGYALEQAIGFTERVNKYNN
ncbi:MULTISPECIES: amidase [Sporosarcina]|uniref:amidase n=1 Tax=Sporosarcina TaxID=1569 RepID=UPI001C8F034A|nr:amidase [Sporosarcina aquimarina]MBY0223887.1 amidase [Sporosarcina aquimarina]